MPRVLPQVGQKDLSAYAEERYQVGWDLSQVKEVAGKWTKAKAGAPECLRQVLQ